MADFEPRQFEIGLKFVRWSFAERNNFSEGSFEPNKDAQVIRVRVSAATRVFELELLILLLNTYCLVNKHVVIKLGFLFKSSCYQACVSSVCLIQSLIIEKWHCEDKRYTLVLQLV